MAAPGGLFRRLDRLTVAAEAPVRRVVGSNRLNPLPHAGTISVFLLFVVVVTGVYLTFFFEFGFAESYQAVARMQAHPIQRVVRGVHRFASASLVMTTLVHGWRTFATGRFDGPRRRRWVTGTLALGVVWLAGVTGYWLIWDTRAQALTEVTGRLAGAVSARWEVAIALGEGTGWVSLFVMLVVHLLLTAVIGYALWRHLRRTRHAWLPPRRWMWLMGGSLVAVAIVLPAGMLPAADPTGLVGSLPLDPFVMFLLPPLLSAWPWTTVVVATVVGGVAAGLPWLLRRSAPPVAVVLEDRCTGCELCVIDCPYLALSMSAGVAVVDPDRCVGCGICAGSCAFSAIAGFGSLAGSEVRLGVPLVLACSRLASAGDAGASRTVVGVTCTGVLNPGVVGSLIEAGAASVQIVGCPPGDCAYGAGNTLAAERFSGRRRPVLPRLFGPRVSQDWVPRLEEALARPGAHGEADPGSAPPGWSKLVPVALVVVASVVAVRWATDARLVHAAEQAGVRVVVDHEPGSVLAGHAAPTGGSPAAVEVWFERSLAERRPLDGDGRLTAVVDVALDPAAGDLEVRLVEGAGFTVLASGLVELVSGERLLVTALDTPPPPGAESGRRLFEGSGLGANAGCQVCHSVEAGETRVGPPLAGIATVAGLRVPGLDAEGYLRQSILDPDAFVVEGYPAGQMLDDYDERLTTAEVEAIVAYLLTLEATP